MMLFITCCKNCDKRCNGCHSHCEEYKKEKAKNEEIRQKAAREGEAFHNYINSRKTHDKF